MTTTLPTIFSVFHKIALRIILEQENIVGALAWQEAKHVPGLVIVEHKKTEVAITGEPKTVINNLVKCYEDLFGKLSHDVCREAVVDLTAYIPAEDVPESLK